MRILLLFAVVYSVWATNQPPSKMKLQTDKDSSEFSGNFRSIYLTSSDAKMPKENGFLRIYTRNIRYYLNRNNSKKLSVSFNTREDDNCENHTVVEYIGNLVLDKQGNTTDSQKKENGEYTGSNSLWALTTRFRTIPYFWIYSPDLGKRVSGMAQFSLIKVSDTTILFQVFYIKNSGKTINMTAALSTSSTLDNDSKEEYFKATNLYNIPSENIKDMTQTDSCPS
ncbi:male-specific submandibular salivary gland protein-like isoform X1 [Microtus oregoni]|uniref:male-specific submandibular salivary gland protein-like isoform X1 n=1 Tax=Microtus oregoni TaxID=111838 RepID=UPI001BB115B5|nr:male-specific submandibular salivary gland protein-like isoform X1 [Microtus oregoni]XP_041502527.1 male-specific submandibular salivary gland protein-like isoform X1 [Microtus oregoni]XP_041502744.1 male-specific submandibular salivary gland protein-like isoform X1 [Microtus oregoni]XP_041502745.1 male-specific submandibular salivary gland protein-like isoform X1 [Microtus oregoni]